MGKRVHSYNYRHRVRVWQKRLEARARANLAAPPCIDCGDQTQPPYKRCGPCELRHHYETEDRKHAT